MEIQKFWTFNNITKSEVPSLSMTVPEQTLTIKELLERFTLGMPMNEEYRQGYYSDDDNLEDPLFDQFDFTDLDLSDLQRLQEYTKARVTELQAEQHQQLLQEQEAKKQARLEALKNDMSLLKGEEVFKEE